MRVLVTGSAGFIGQAVAAELAARGWETAPFDGPQSVLDPAALDLAVVGCDAVINLAGVLGTAETVGAEHHAAEVNILGALNVLDAAQAVPVVQIATGATRVSRTRTRSRSAARRTWPCPAPGGRGSR